MKHILFIGRHVKLPCRVEGIPEPEVYWISPTEERFAQGDKAGKNVATRGKMHIKSSTLADDGWWWCVAESKFYFEYLPIRLTVLPRYDISYTRSFLPGTKMKCI